MLIFSIITLLFTRFYALLNVGVRFYNFEGLYEGWLAKELLDGAGRWYIFNHPYMTSEGGSVTTSYIASLFFRIFGDSFFSLELVPILFSVLMLTGFYLLLKRHFSIYAAIIFSFLFIFPPPVFFRSSLVVASFHFQSILFAIISLFCFFEIFFNENNYKAYIEKAPNKKINLLFISLGIVSGFGIYFDYSIIIMLSTIILFWLLIDKRFYLKKYFFIFLSGFLIGLLPWVIYNCTHNFMGLVINGYAPSKIIFHKNLIQIFQTFKYICTKQLYENLRHGLYPVVFISLIFVTFLNFNTLRYSKIKYLSGIKELIFISYILIFIFTWSVLYLPSGQGQANIPLWMSGVDGRVIHVYSFLFVLVALFCNRLLPLKKDKNYFLKLSFSLIFAILILRIGFLNYSHLISEPEQKILPLEIKGYSVRVACSRNLISINSVLEQDVLNGCRIAEHDYDAEFWYFFQFDDAYFSLYAKSSEPLQKIMADAQTSESGKPHDYLLIGLNTGDLVRGYDILNLNKLTLQKIPIQYRHYYYEGVAISLMNRRRDEVMKNIDFIEKIPAEYRHYFLLELGRVIGSYPDDKTKKEKLQYSIKRFPGIYENYIRRGLVGSSVNDNLLENYHKDNIKKEDLPYFYRAISRHLFGGLPSEDTARSSLKKYAVDKDNERYFYWGIVEVFFKEGGIVCLDDFIKRKTKEIIKCNLTNKDALAEGLGLSLGHLTLGYLKRFTEFIEASLDANQLSHFYYGYCISLKERYGLDFSLMKNLIDENITGKSKEMCYRIIADTAI